MDKFDIVGALDSYATSKGLVFIYGNDEHRNYEAQQAYNDGQTVLGSTAFLGSPTILNGKFPEIVYTGDLYLGRKFDSDGTAASIDETYKQKYDRRIKELNSELATFISSFACDNELDATGLTMRMEVNTHDTNIDFVATLVTFTQEGH